MVYHWEDKFLAQDPLSKFKKYSQINAQVRRRFEEASDHGHPVNEISLRQWALEATDSIRHPQVNFKEGGHRLSKFKKGNRIVDRRITIVVSRANMD